MKRVIATFLAIVVLVLAGCTPSVPNQTMTPPPAVDQTTEATLVDRTWISPGVVQIGNYYAGARAEWYIRVHNGKDTVARFNISFRVPDNTRDGYDMPQIGAQSWIIIADPTPVLAPKETRDILIVLAVPSGVKISSQQWEFWISIIEQGQGQIQTEMCSRWLVSMRS